jgi:hypothetical protein
MLPTLKCSCGKDVIDGKPEEPVLVASSFETCRRVCSCGIAYSNAATADTSKLTKIYSDPFTGLPSYLVADYPDVLNAALNVTNRPTKKKKFHFSTSEDHVTWTLFHFLLHESALASTFRRLKVADSANEPELLLWGVRIPYEFNQFSEMRKQVEGICNGLGELPSSRSEPDVILSFGGAGVVFIEVKLGSGNAHPPSKASNWERYFEQADAFANSEQAKESGLYELVRNWRIACACAAERPVTLINLGPKSLFEPPRNKVLIEFEQSLNRKTNRVFRRMTWVEFLDAIPNRPDWLNKYILERKVLDPVPPAEDAAL